MVMQFETAASPRLAMSLQTRSSSTNTQTLNSFKNMSDYFVMSPVPDTAVKVRGVLKLCSSYDRMFYIDVKNFIIADDFLVFSKDSHRYKEMLV